MDYAAVLGREPGEVVRPETINEVAAVVARAYAEKKAVVPWGGGTAQQYGYAPQRCDVLLDLSGLRRIVALEPGDLVATVEAGATLSDLQTALTAHGQYLPLDAPHPEQATFGGILATDAYGPSRIGYGTARDWLIGITVVDPQGRIIRGGGKVVKNVTGYDLPKLHVGALGTLGVIVEATFKVAPKPETTRALLVDLAAGDVAYLVSSLQARTDPALCLLYEESGLPPAHYLFLVFRGQVEVVDAAVEIVEELVREAGASAPRAIDDSLTPADPQPEDIIVRFAAPPGEGVALHEAVAAEEIASRLHSLPGVSRVDAFCETEDAATALLAWARKQMVPYVVFQAPLALRSRENIDLWRPLPQAFPLMQQLKATLDPAGILNPGRFVGRI